MKKIAFIGGFDKLDLIQYVAIILHNLGKKVLLVDTTRMQKSRFMLPAGWPSIPSIFMPLESLGAGVG